MAIKGILVDYYYCTGCHTCEMACATSHDLPIDKAGVKLHHEGAYEIDGDIWQDDHIPFFTKNCNFCQDGEAAHDGVPMCVHHCQARCLTIGDMDELARKLAERPNQVLYALDV